MSDKRVALVTGGTQGLGAAISRTLQKEGYTVVAVYVGPREVADAFTKETGIEAIECDVSNYEVCKTTLTGIATKYGQVDIIVNNAGITRDAFLHKMERSAWDAVINVNLSSIFNTCQVLMTGMRERGFGRIVNISSINGRKGQFGQANYSAAKAGMLGFTRAVAQEGANKGITVNAICPGYIATDMTKAMKPEILDGMRQQIPMGRLGEPQEIADMVAYLVSDKAKFITGATFDVNGGMWMG